MLRSFHYAASTSLFDYLQRMAVRAEEAAALRGGTRLWYLWSGAEFLRSYLRTAGIAPFVPRSREELTVLLHVYLLEKAVYELDYELNNRPAWVEVPLRGIVELLDDNRCG
jgi:maltose alpha-D-glucosyltransferase/alpha-amylase